MNKPYIVCYMMTPVDGRINCAMTEKLPGVEEYYPLLEELGLQSGASGKDITAKKVSSRVGYSVVADTKGTLLWKNDSEYDQPHIILISRQVSREYLG